MAKSSNGWKKSATSSTENGRKPPAATHHAKKTRFFDLAEKAGLVGCISGPPDLAQRFKRYLKLKPRASKKTPA